MRGLDRQSSSTCSLLVSARGETSATGGAVSARAGSISARGAVDDGGGVPSSETPPTGAAGTLATLAEERTQTAAAAGGSDGAPAAAASLEGEDLALLPELTSEGLVLARLSERHAAGRVYTHINSMLLAVNPYAVIEGTYGPEVMERYARHGERQPAHAYGLTYGAYRGVLEGRCQSVVISGESGAVP